MVWFVGWIVSRMAEGGDTEGECWCGGVFHHHGFVIDDGRDSALSGAMEYP